jgi:4-amino-4-deoxy-L-arabinose transferase-like glycosyltransferase
LAINGLRQHSRFHAANLNGRVLVIILLGAWLRFHALALNTRFHPDEALFATFARSAAVQGDWLLHGHLDKPPLTIYANALAMSFFGVTTLPDGVLTLDVHRGEFASRIPNTFASILLIPVLYSLGNRSDHAGDRIRLIVSLLAALSPLALAFSATAFTDPLMVLCITLALWAGSRRRWLWSGIWLALGFWCKQQALFYGPLISALGWIQIRQSGKGVRQYRSALLLTIAPVVAGVILLFMWDNLRGQSTSLWALAAANNDPGRLADMNELLPRLLKWGEYAQFLTGGGILTAALLCISLYGVYRQRKSAQASQIDTLLPAYSVIYLVAHWLIAIGVYDRYLLPVLPVILLLMARGLEYLSRKLSDPHSYAKKVILVSLCVCGLIFALPSAWDATEGQLPIGGDRGQHQGIDALGHYLDNKALGAIIYDHWLGWELGYYIGAWSDKRRVYYPTPEALVTDALLQPDPALRYFVAPRWENFQPWIAALKNANFDIRLDYEQASFVVYELVPPRAKNKCSVRLSPPTFDNILHRPN